MLSIHWTRSRWIAFALLTAIAVSGLPSSAQTAEQKHAAENNGNTLPGRWETPARERRMPLRTGIHGTLTVNVGGITFRSDNGRSQSWPSVAIRTALVAPHRMVIKTYVNRSLHRPGERRYEFDLTNAIPASVAATFADGVARPLQSSVPDSEASAIAAIPAHHRSLTGGTNGVLRFRQDGIDYVTPSKEDSRTWRWADLQTLSNPDPYHLFLFGYRDTYTFDLKAPLTQALFDSASDAIYGHNLSLPVVAPGTASVHPSDKDSSLGVAQGSNPQGAEIREK